MVRKGLGVCRNCTLDAGIDLVLLKVHLLRVDVPCSEGETPVSVGLDSVLMLLDQCVKCLREFMTNFKELLDLSPDHDHHVTMLHWNLQNLSVCNLPAFCDLCGVLETFADLGPEAHGGRRSEGEGRDDRAKLMLTVIVVLQLLHISAGKTITSGTTNIDLVILHIPKCQELVEIRDFSRPSLQANLVRRQLRKEVIGSPKCNLLRPDQAEEATENRVWGIGKALRLDRNTKFIPRTLVSLVESQTEWK